MSFDSFISIDQNSHVLWDTVPKLHVLQCIGAQGSHFIEDVDTAFTKRGSHVGDQQLEIARERYYRDGSSDWGASLFYSDFLGRTPIKMHMIEPYTGMSTKALAKAVGCSVDDLYDRYAQSDNWQLVGTSYIDDTTKHRVIGDLRLTETFPYLTQLLQHARQDILQAFPERNAQQRTDEWFNAQRTVVEELAASMPDASLVEFYRAWMAQHLSPASVDCRMTSEFFRARLAEATQPLLTAFLHDYDTMSSLYNQAIQTTDTGLDTLAAKRGELPFFAVFRDGQRVMRTEMFFDGRQLVTGDRAWDVREGRLPVEKMTGNGLLCIVGKAVLLVLQARLKPTGGPLVLPEHGSLYMPAVHAFAASLRNAGMGDLQFFPMYRVHLNFLTALAEADTQVRLPEYLIPAFGQDELSCAEFAARLPTVMTEAATHLEQIRDADARQQCVHDLNPPLAAEVEALQEQQKQLARNPETRDQASIVWDRIKELKQQQLEMLVDDILRALHVRRLSYWNSRGALLPWSIAAGGTAFYENLIRQATVAPESADNET